MDPALVVDTASRFGLNSSSFAEQCPLESLPKLPYRYVLCHEDRFISPDWSRRAAPERLGVEPIELPGSHMPTNSRPESLRPSCLLAGTDAPKSTQPCPTGPQTRGQDRADGRARRIPGPAKAEFLPQPGPNARVAGAENGQRLRKIDPAERDSRSRRASPACSRRLVAVGLARQRRLGAARVVVLGQTAETPPPSCPGKSSTASRSSPAGSRATSPASRSIADGVAAPYEAPFDGKIVAWSITLARPSTTETENDHRRDRLLQRLPRPALGGPDRRPAPDRGHASRPNTRSSARARSRSSTPTSAARRSSPSSTR